MNCRSIYVEKVCKKNHKNQSEVHEILNNQQIKVYCIYCG